MASTLSGGLRVWQLDEREPVPARGQRVPHDHFINFPRFDPCSPDRLLNHAAPKSVALKELSAPFRLPIGVRTAAAMKDSCITHHSFLPA